MLVLILSRSNCVGGALIPMMLVIDSSYSSHMINTELSGFNADTCGYNPHICRKERTRSTNIKISASPSYMRKVDVII